MRSESKETIQRLMSLFGNKQKNLAEFLSVPSSTTSFIVNRRRPLTRSMIGKISNLGVSIDWLLLGVGSRQLKEEVNKENTSEFEITKSLNSEEAEVIKQGAEALRNLADLIEQRELK